MRRGARSPGMERIEKLCREHGVPLTVQRRAVLQVLMARRDHPTADQIYLEVFNGLPGVSRTTVYRVLEAFVALGIARRVCHPDAAVRFEIESRRHHHLICLTCGRMADLEDPGLDSIPLPASKAQGFLLTDYSIQFRGTCSDCARAHSAATRGKPGRNPQPQ